MDLNLRLPASLGTTGNNLLCGDGALNMPRGAEADKDSWGRGRGRPCLPLDALPRADT